MRTIRKLLIGRSALPGGGGCAASASPAGGVSGRGAIPVAVRLVRQGRRRGPVAHRPGDDGGRLRGGILPGGIVEMGVDGGGAPLAVALPGRSAMDANQSFTCSTAMASTVMWPKAGMMYLPTM